MVLTFVLLLLFILQIVLFPKYYEYVKTREITGAASAIEESWGKGDAQEVTTKLAKSLKMYIEIASPSNPLISFQANEIGGSLDFIKLGISELKDSVVKSENGYIFKRYTDTVTGNSALLYGTYIGSKSHVDAYIFVYSNLQPLGTTTQILQSQFMMITLFVLFVSLVLAVFSSAHISKPIIRINNSAKKLPQGIFDATVGKDEYEEVQQLAQTLKEAAGEIAKTDNLRKELMANISHDLRTPLTMIKAYAEMIRDLSGENPEKRAKHLCVIIEETDRLSALVSDIMDLSKLESGNEALNINCIDFSAHLNGIISRFSILVERDGYDITVEAEQGIVICADITKLEQVVYNLVNNAVNYTGDDKKITVKLFRKGGFARFEVHDTGEGIDAENLPYIWERYYKVKSADGNHKRAKVGTGLGLSIVKNILEQHGFAYGAESEVGKGSVFWFEMPLESSAETKPAKPLARFSKKNNLPS